MCVIMLLVHHYSITERVSLEIPPTFFSSVQKNCEITLLRSIALSFEVSVLQRYIFFMFDKQQNIVLNCVFIFTHKICYTTFSRSRSLLSCVGHTPGQRPQTCRVYDILDGFMCSKVF